MRLMTSQAIHHLRINVYDLAKLVWHGHDMATGYQMIHCQILVLTCLLTPERSTTNSLRERGHNFELYEYNYKFFRQSYAVNCLFKFLGPGCQPKVGILDLLLAMFMVCE